MTSGEVGSYKGTVQVIDVGVWVWEDEKKYWVTLGYGAGGV